MSSVRQSARIVLCAVVLSAAGARLDATTYAGMPDAALLDQATHVAELGFLRSVQPIAPGAPVTEYLAIVTRPLKGSFPSSTVRLRLPGGRSPEGAILAVYGVPTPRSGDDAIVFLIENEDGSFGVLHWALGLFRKVVAGGDGPFALRDLRNADLVDLPLDPSAPHERDYAAFSDWLRDRAAGVRRAPDYLREAPAERLRARFNLSVVSGHNLRWLEFNNGGTIDFRIRGAGSFGSSGQLTPAMQAWVREGTTPVRLQLIGGTSSTAGLSRPDGVNALIYGDPNGIMPGKFTCGTGGTLASGGVWFLRESSVFRGRRHFRIVEGDIVINDGVECRLAGQPRRSAELFTHELGHTLGISHSCGDTASGPCTNAQEDDATMRGTVHFDERGASIRGDDIAALRALYEGPGGDAPPPPAPSAPGEPTPSVVKLEQPTNLGGKAASGKKIELSWEDNSTGEGSYDVLIKVPKGDWTTLLTLPADSTSAVIRELEKGINYKFKVRSRQGERVSPFSEIVQVRTLGRSAPEDPSGLQVVEVSSREIALSWDDNSDNEKAFVLWLKIGDGEWRVSRKTGSDVTEASVAVAPATEYSFRVRAKVGNKLSGFSNVVTVTTPAA